VETTSYPDRSRARVGTRPAGQQSGSDWIAVPADLSNGGASFQTWFVSQSAQGPAQPVLP
jgi:hypothetical protein